MKRGVIVLTPFPFTDLSGRKVRPALAVSRSDRPGSDVILAFISTHRNQPLLTTDLLLDAAQPDFAATGLKTTAIVKLDKLVTVETSVVLGELGELSTIWLQQAAEKLRHALEL